MNNHTEVPIGRPITLRLAREEDTERLARLAQLDGARLPARPVLLAEAGGELRAALSLSDDTVVADPFRPTARLVYLLRARAKQLRPIREVARLARGHRYRVSYGAGLS